MAQWTDNFRNHAVHTTLQNIRDKSESVNESDAELTPEGIEAASRLDLISRQAQSVLADIDPVLTTSSVLDELESSSTDIENGLDDFLSDFNENHLITANSSADRSLETLSRLAALVRPVDLDGIGENINSLRTSSTEYMNKMKSETETLQQQVEETTSAFRSELDAFGERINTEETKLLDLANTHETQFKETQDQRVSQALEARATEDTEREERKQQLAEETDEFFTKQRELAEAQITRLEEYRSQAETIAQIVADTGMSGGYQRIANQEWWTAKVWQVLTVGAFGGLIYFTVDVFYATLSGSVTVQEVLGRTLITIPFILLAAFTSRLASVHGRSERANRKKQLALASIDSYLSGMSEEKIAEIKEAFAHNFFTDDLVESEMSLLSSSDNSESTPIDLAMEIARKYPNPPQ